MYPGMEKAITPNLDNLVTSGCILPLSEGEYVLLEIPFYSLPLGLEEIIESLDKIGKTILAHPERGKEFQENPVTYPGLQTTWSFGSDNRIKS